MENVAAHNTANMVAEQVNVPPDVACDDATSDPWRLENPWSRGRGMDADRDMSKSNGSQELHFPEKHNETFERMWRKMLDIEAMLHTRDATAILTEARDRRFQRWHLEEASRQIGAS